jgi:serine/threonine protein kinase
MAGQCPTDGTLLAPIGEDVLLGTTIGAYRIARLLGIGGMGRVYKGVHPTIGSRVAIKVLSRECTDRRDLVERFFAEAKAVNLIRHESIVNVLDLAVLPDGRPYIIMEYLDGAPLAAVIEHAVHHGQPLPLGGLARLAVEVLDALQAAHGKNIVHRDLKPDNIFVAPSGRPKVLDFGIAKLIDPGTGSATATGSLLGTPHYMSPEQAAGRPVDHRADIYAIGVILFECVTGRKPFVADSLFELLRKHVEEPAPPPRMLRPDLDPGFEGVILCALAKAPDQRFATAQAMSMALQNATAHLPPEQWTPITGSGTHRALPSGWQHTPPASWGSGSRASRAAPRPSESPLQYLANQSTVSSSSGQVQKQAAPAKKSRKGLWLGLAVVAVLIGIGVTVAVVNGSESETVAADTPAPPPDPGKPADPADKAGDKPGDKPIAKIADGTPPGGGPGNKPAKVEDDEDDDEKAADEAFDAATKGLPEDVRKKMKDAAKANNVVIVGKNVRIGSNVQIGTGAADDPKQAPKGDDQKPAKGADDQPAKPGKRWVQDRALSYAGWNPKRVDVDAFLKFAVAEAKKAVPDAQLTRIEINGATPDGFANVELRTLASDHGEVELRFISPSASKLDPNIPEGVPQDRLCEFRITGSPDGVEITPMFKSNCKEKSVPLPACSVAALWNKAQGQGASKNAVANISYYQASMHSTPRWFFTIGFGFDVTFSKMWSGPGC